MNLRFVITLALAAVVGFVLGNAVTAVLAVAISALCSYFRTFDSGAGWTAMETRVNIGISIAIVSGFIAALIFKIPLLVSLFSAFGAAWLAWMVVTSCVRVFGRSA